MTIASPLQDWPAAPRLPVLHEAEMHIWRADALSLARHEARLTALLPKAQSLQGGKVSQGTARHRSLLARGVLRDILGRYLGHDPRGLQFIVTSLGKPLLDPQVHAGAPQFSVSHSGDLVLFAFARKHEVGIDVEAIRDDIELADLAQRFFAPAESRELLALPEAARLNAFYAGWTRKEAYVKARGAGIGYGLERFAVTLRPDQPARLISDDRCAQEVGQWHLENLALGTGFSACAAVRSKDLSFRYWMWQEPADDDGQLKGVDPRH
ncbi:MAG: 4'-phosphopantetheinyl transferase family protein [Rhodoferax sp.]